MRILHVCSRYWPGLGGGENYLREISERLVAEGHSVTVITTDADDTELFWDPSRRRFPGRYAEQGGVRIRRFPLRHLPLAPLSYSLWRYLVFPRLAAWPGFPLHWLIRLSRFTPWSPEMWRWAQTTSETFDLIGAIGILYEPFVALAAQFAIRHNLPLVVTPLTHLGAGARPAQDPVSRYYTMRHQIELVRTADRVAVMTPTEGAFYQQQGVLGERIRVAPPGVTLQAVLGGQAERFRAKHQLRRPIVAFLSAMSPDKGVVHVVQAIQKLWQQGLPVELVLAGKRLATFDRFWLTLPAADRQRIILLGPITEAEKHDLLAASDIVAMPSRTDSFGIIYLEAWLYEKPVIGAQAWGMADVIRDGDDGVLVPFGDVPALAQAIAELVNHPERRERLGRCGAARVHANYTWEQRYAVVRDLYQELFALRRQEPAHTT
jgi:glycosyltransferase involved in cell wall biosynthesis